VSAVDSRGGTIFVADATQTPAGANSKATRLLDLPGKRINYRVHGSSCPLDNAMADILRCLRSAFRHVSRRVDRPCLNAANGYCDCEND